MKILFITPLLYSYVERWMPLGICSMAAVLKNQGHDVFLFDRTVEFILLGKNRQELQNKMKKYIQDIAPDLIAFSTVTPAIYDTVDSVDFIGMFFKGTMIAGGHHSTALPRETLEKIPRLNGVIVGEGEYALAAFADGKDPKSIPGFYGHNNHFLEPGLSGRISKLDDLPFPLLDLLNMPYYIEANSATIRGFYLSTACVLTSRGCYHNCSYCSESLTYGQGVRFHSSEYAVENIKKILTDHPVNGLYVLDNDFLANRDRAEKICRLLINNKLHKKIKWAIQTRTDQIDSNIIKLLKKAGCVKVEMGVESFDPSILKNVNKAVTVSRTIQSIKLCQDNGLKVHAYMLVGFENESIADLNRQLKWIKRLRPDSFSWSQVKLYPGTKLYNKKGNCYFETHGWSEMNVKAFFEKDLLTSIDPEDKKKWAEQKLKPYMWWTLTLSHLRNNNIKFILNTLKNKNFLAIIIESFKRLKQLCFRSK